MKPGEIIICPDQKELVANENLEVISIPVRNIGDRPIQVGSHMHFLK